MWPFEWIMNVAISLGWIIGILILLILLILLLSLLGRISPSLAIWICLVIILILLLIHAGACQAPSDKRDREQPEQVITNPVPRLESPPSDF